MYKFIPATALASLFALAPIGAVNAETQANAPSDMKLTQKQCETLWSQAHAGGSGDLSIEKAKPYLKDFEKADIDNSKSLSSDEWNGACEKGWVMSEATVPAAGAAAVSSDAAQPGGETSDRTPGGATDRKPGSTTAGAPGVAAGQTPDGTSDRTPGN